MSSKRREEPWSRSGASLPLWIAKRYFSLTPSLPGGLAAGFSLPCFFLSLR